MRVAMIGAGGIGAYYGARLHAAGHRVVFVARGEHLRVLQATGLSVSHPEFQFSGPVEALDLETLCRTTTPAGFDLLILAVKAGATAEIANALAEWFGRCGAETPVLSLQNGVDNEAVLAQALGASLVLGGLAVRIGTHVEAPGRITATGVGQVIAGPWPQHGEASAATLSALEALTAAGPGAGIPVQETADIRRELWRKLVINNGINPLSALTGWDSQRLTHDPRMAPMVRRLMAEAAAAAAADGVSLGEDDVAEMFGIVYDLQGIKTSMLVDREHGRPLEVEEICGAVLARAATLGQEAAGTALAAALLRSL